MNYKSVLLLLVASFVYSKSATIEEEAKNSTAFTLEWYRSSFDANNNIVVSPLSFRILLSLLYQSTSGETEIELKNNVHFSDKEETAVSQRLTLDKLIASPNLKVVNRIYVKKGDKLSKSFVAKAEQYHSGVEQKDFEKSQQTANEINQFIEEQTNGLIKNLIKKDSLNNKTALLLLNTLYFKANWATEFKEGNVRKSDFNGIDGKKYNIDFMKDKRSFKVYDSELLKATTIEISYVAESNAKFWIILPHENSNINTFKDTLEADTIKVIDSNLSDDHKEIWIPKFEIESEIDGMKQLKKLGMKSLFEKSEIEALDGGAKLKVSDAKQKAKIIVNTKGTEAAAATMIAVSFGSRPGPPPPPPLIVDRPFIYMILTADTNEPLFIGHFSKPNSAPV